LTRGGAKLVGSRYKLHIPGKLSKNNAPDIKIILEIVKEKKGQRIIVVR